MKEAALGHCKMFNSILGPYPLERQQQLPTLAVSTKHVTRHCQVFLSGRIAKSPHCCEPLNYGGQPSKFAQDSGFSTKRSIFWDSPQVSCPPKIHSLWGLRVAHVPLKSPKFFQTPQSRPRVCRGPWDEATDKKAFETSHPRGPGRSEHPPH